MRDHTTGTYGELYRNDGGQEVWRIVGGDGVTIVDEVSDDRDARFFVFGTDDPSDRQRGPQDASRPLVVGDRLADDFCGGVFGRDFTGPARIEALGPDWVVVRNPAGRPWFAQIDPSEITVYR